jgi:acetyl esterase/lipase
LGKKIYAIGLYGDEDERQGYYVYLPDNFSANSKIVVLVHGGSWISGPDPEQTYGWGSAYSTNPTQDNIVKNLLAQGYVVVVPLYRLVQYGDNNTDILSNTVTIQDQVDDIDAAIQDVHNIFPNCLGINANNIQVIGESAGANLALLFAYTQANTSYIKSVVSVAGPTNMNQFANWLMSPPFAYSCGTDFIVDNPNTTIFTHFPYYNVYDPIVPLITTAFVNPVTCNVANIKLGLFLTISPTSDNTAKRILNSYRLTESCVKQVITNPLSNTAFNNISPCAVLNASRIVPTFIIHGTDDWIVPYSKATNTMDTKLNSTGGLIGTYSSTGSGIPASSTYATTNNKHLIKLYAGSNHNVSDHSQTQPDIIT